MIFAQKRIDMSKKHANFASQTGRNPATGHS